MKKVLYKILKLTILALLVGVFIAGYQFVGHEVISFSKYLLNERNLIWISTIACSILLLVGLMFVNKKYPGYYGSGVPQIEAYHRGWYDINPYKNLLFITINSLFAFFGGFLLGSEGPSVTIGSSIGMIGNKAFKDENKNDVALFGSAGFACAFSSPLAGLCHLLEENKHLISWKFILKGIYVIALSFIISYLIYPHSLLPKFEFGFMPFKFYFILIFVVGLCVGVSKLYMYLIIKVKDLTKGKQIMFYLTPVVLVGFMILRRFFPVLIGNGLDSLNIEVLDYSLLIILGIFLFRLIFTSISISSNLSGGLVLPTLAIGSLVAILSVKGISLLFPEINEYIGLFIICGMLVVLAVVTNAPITAFVLGLKCAPFKVVALPLFICLTICMIPFYVFKWSNIYHQLEKRIPGYISE